MRMVVLGIKDIWELSVIHRDMKLANIVLHFPDNPELNRMNRNEKKKFLQTVDFTKINFQAKIADFGLSTILDEYTKQLSICGTPLYSSPQLLKKKSYSTKVDTWAIGVMLYELLMGKTPFHSYEMKDLLNKINDGKYSINLREPVTIECSLFLAETLQFEERERISDSNLVQHPFVATENGWLLEKVNKDSF